MGGEEWGGRSGGGRSGGRCKSHLKTGQWFSILSDT